MIKAFAANDKAQTFNVRAFQSSIDFQRGLFLLSEGRIEEARQVYEHGTMVAEEMMDLDSLEGAIVDLRTVKDSRQIIADIILKRLKETRMSIAPTAKSNPTKCYRLRL
jgi:hypothetical protein